MELELLRSRQTEGKRRFFPFSVHLHVMLGCNTLGLCFQGAGSRGGGHRKAQFMGDADVSAWKSTNLEHLWEQEVRVGKGPIPGLNWAFNEDTTQEPEWDPIKTQSRQCYISSPKAPVVPSLQRKAKFIYEPTGFHLSGHCFLCDFISSVLFLTHFIPNKPASLMFYQHFSSYLRTFALATLICL